MPGFTTTSDGGWSFSFSEEPEIPDLPVHDPLDSAGPKVVGYLDDPKRWENYSDLVIYELEVLLRKFLETKLDDPNWKGAKTYWKRYTCGLMFEQLYGRRPNMKDHDDIVKLRRMPRLLAYYSSKVQKAGMVRGKQYTKTVYTLSLRRYKKNLPYSLRIRLKDMQEKGEIPTWQNLRLPKDDLKPGHARNPQTDENMRRRRERAKQIYNERYSDRHEKRVRHDAGQLPDEHVPVKDNG